MGAVFGMFAGFYYWIGKISGLQYPKTLGQIHFWLFFVGVLSKCPNWALDASMQGEGLSYKTMAARGKKESDRACRENVRAWKP